MKIGILIPLLNNSGPSNGAIVLQAAIEKFSVHNVDIVELKLTKFNALKNYDLLISFCMRSDVMGFLAKCIFGIKLISTMRSNIYEDYRFLYGIKGLPIALLNNFIFLFCDHLVVMYPSMFEGLYIKSPSFRDRILVIPNLIEDREVLRAISQFNKVERLVFIGSLTERKNVGIAIELGKTFYEHGIKIVLIGDGPLRCSLEDKVKHLNLDDCFVFYGNVPDPYSLLLPNDIVVSNSMSEGMSRALMDVVSMGYPVVARRLVGATDFILEGENGFLYEDLPELFARINSMLDGTFEGFTSRQLPDDFAPTGVTRKWLTAIEQMDV